jgi:hypothetical protein
MDILTLKARHQSEGEITVVADRIKCPRMDSKSGIKVSHPSREMAMVKQQSILYSTKEIY